MDEARPVSEPASPLRSERPRTVSVALLVLLLSLGLLLYVGYGKAQQTYPRLRLDALAAVGEVSAGSESDAGVPLFRVSGPCGATHERLRQMLGAGRELLHGV